MQSLCKEHAERQIEKKRKRGECGKSPTRRKVTKDPHSDYTLRISSFFTHIALPHRPHRLLTHHSSNSCYQPLSLFISSPSRFIGTSRGLRTQFSPPRIPLTYLLALFFIPPFTSPIPNLLLLRIPTSPGNHTSSSFPLFPSGWTSRRHASGPSPPCDKPLSVAVISSLREVPCVFCESYLPPLSVPPTFAKRHQQGGRLG